MNEVSLRNISSEIKLAKEYEVMLDNITSIMPAIQNDSMNFYKPDSQLKNVTLDITEITPIATLKHILAVIEKIKLALQEAHFDYRKKQIELNDKNVELQEAVGSKKELLAIEIEEIEMKIGNSKNYTSGAIRKLNYMVNQYQAIMKKIGKTEITEEEYELEESRYHIATALKQAMCSARTRGGIIDEGNHIYLFELGINGQVVQYEMFAFFQMEENLLKLGQEPTHEMTLKWIEQMCDKFISHPSIYAASRGLKSIDPTSFHKAKELLGGF